MLSSEQISEQTIFEETQRLSGMLTISILAGAGGIFAAVIVSKQAQTPLPHAVFIALIAVAVSLLLTARSRLITRVTSSRAEVSFPPFPGTKIVLLPDEIASLATQEVGLLTGGIGYHIGWNSIYITASTGTAVAVTRKNGKRVVIGTKNPMALMAALQEMRGTSAG